MFTHDVNGTFSHSVKNQQMHPTYERLAEALQIAKELKSPPAPGEIATSMCNLDTLRVNMMLT